MPRPLCVEDYIAFDLETTGLNPETDEILEVAMVRFQGGEPVERWSSLVNPGVPVPLKTLRLTGIDAGELESSPPLEDLLGEIRDFMEDLPLVGHNSGFDASFLAKRVPGFPGVPLYDTLELSRIVVPGYSSYRLTDLAQVMGVPVSEAHRAYDDAEVSGVIFGLLQEAVQEMSVGSRDAVRSLLGAGWVATKMFQWESAAPKLHWPDRPITLTQISLFDEQAEESGLLEDALLPLLAREGVHAAQAPATDEAAAEVARAAGRYATATGRRVLLVGFPAEAVPHGAVSFGSPQDYLCLARLDEAAKQALAGAYDSRDLEQRKFLASLYRWSEVTRTGALAEVQWGSAGHEVVAEIACPSNMACEGSCPSRDKCFYVLARARTAPGRPGLVAGAIAPVGAEGPFDAALVFGTHNLGRTWRWAEPRVDLQALGASLSRAGVAGDVPAFEALSSSAGADLSRGGTVFGATASLAAKVAVQLEVAANALRQAQGGAEPGGYPVDPPLLWKDLHVLEEAARVLRESCSEATGAETVFLAEHAYGDESRRGAVLVRRHVWPARAAVESLRRQANSVVLLSDLTIVASRSPGGRRYLGLDDGEACVDLEPVFRPCDRGEVLMAVPDCGGLVPPREYPVYLARLIEPLAMKARKGLLVAFPSRSLLKETYGLVQPALEAQGVAVYGQGVDGGRRVVEHLAEEDAVVFAMAGSGPRPGDPVPECFVLTRVPFAPPNPLDDVRKRQLSSPAGGFVEASVRPAELALRSCVERMLRAGGKRVVVVADPRVLPGRSSWGAEFMFGFDDLPRIVCPANELLSRLP